MTISELTLKSSAEEPVRPFEVFTGAGRRREWAPEDKARIVAESFEPEATVSDVARRHALSPQQLFTWRREARKASEMMPAFVPAVVTPEPVRCRSWSSCLWCHLEGGARLAWSGEPPLCHLAMVRSISSMRRRYSKFSTSIFAFRSFSS